MKRAKAPFRKKPFLIAFLVVAPFVLFAAEKILEYASPPAKEKDCNFVYPAGVDQTKRTTLVAQSPERRFTFAQLGGFINDVYSFT